MSTAAAEAPPLPFEFFDVRVLRTCLVSPSMMRVTLGGDRLSDCVSGARDQRIKLFLPQPDQDAPLVPTDAGEEWFTRWREMDPKVRGIMRTYTVREQRRDPEELDIDFALHGTGGAASGEEPGPAAGHAASGPASGWAARARPGDRAMLLAPVVADNGGVDFRPPAGTDWVLLSGDETALPAIASILEWLPAGTPTQVWLEVEHADDIQTLPTTADAEIHWLVRDALLAAAAREGSPLSRTDLAPDAVRRTPFPAGTPYAWVAGEASTVRALRRHLVKERGIDRRAVTFTGYWRRGVTEEQLTEEAVAEAAPAPED